MFFGMPPLVFTHVVISLLGVVSGIVVLLGFLGVSGFFLPAHKLLPSHILGILSLIALAIACVARYSKHMLGGWLKTYVITAMISLYFNVFVLIARAFMKVPALHALATHGSEPPFAFAQGVNLVLFFFLTVLEVKQFLLA